jgi:hypothetical protein
MKSFYDGEATEGEWRTLCPMIRARELLNSMNSPRMRTVLLLPTMEKRITRRGMSIPSKQLSTPIRLLSGRKMLIVSL